MDFPSCYLAGYVMKRHGLKGEVKVFFESQIPDTLESLFVELDGRLIPFFIERLGKGRPATVIKFSEIDTPEAADQLIRKKIFLEMPQQARAQRLAPGQMHGFQVYHGSSKLGIASGHIQSSLNPLLVVTTPTGKEILIPVNERFISEIQPNQKRLFVSLPDGFLEI
jgi:16S rRNA processing protein RimM